MVGMGRDDLGTGWSDIEEVQIALEEPFNRRFISCIEGRSGGATSASDFEAQLECPKGLVVRLFKGQ